MKVYYCFVSIIVLLFFSGCHQDIPEPESKSNNKSKKVMESSQDIPVSVLSLNSPFSVRYHVKGNNVLVECIIPEISFRNDQVKKDSGKIFVFVDGKKVEEMNSPVFIIKRLSSGDHTILLEVVNDQNQPYPLKKEFKVEVP